MMKRGVSTTDLCIAATLTTTSKHTATAAVQAQCGEAHQNPIRDSHKPRTINIFHRPPKATWRQWAGEADKASFDDERTQIESLGGGGRVAHLYDISIASANCVVQWCLTTLTIFGLLRKLILIKRK